jgi:hypothetical protein
MFNQNVQQVLQHEKEERISIHCHSNESTFTQRAWEISDGKTCAVQLCNNKNLFCRFRVVFYSDRWNFDIVS